MPQLPPQSESLGRIASACTAAGSVLVHASIRNLFEACHLDLDEPSFLIVLDKEKPSAVFVQVRRYEPEAFVRSTMLSEGWKESFEDDPQSTWPTPVAIMAELSSELAALQTLIGAPYSVLATYAVGGQHRLCWLTDEWSDELSDRIAKICDSRHSRADDVLKQAERMMDGLITELVNDPKFRAIRGRPKRLIYLEKFYGERIPADPRGRVTRPAQNCELVDMNVATVLIKADERIWAEGLDD